jgi:hypothetical protein
MVSPGCTDMEQDCPSGDLHCIIGTTVDATGIQFAFGGTSFGSA